MRTKLFLSFIVGLFMFLSPGLAMAAENGSADDAINDLFAPLTKLVSDFVFWSFELGGADIPVIVIWLIVGAIFFTVYMGFINLRGFKQSFRIVSGKYSKPDDPGEVTHFQALSAALSGTVGLGNIAGVAIAISLGGPGATFWMILAGLFGMTTKFVEVTLGHKYREIDENGVVSGGPMYYLSKGLKIRNLTGLGKTIAMISAFSVIGGAIGSGALYQVNQAAAQFLNVVVPITGGEGSFFYGAGWMFGAIYAGIVGLVIIGGIRKIAHVTEILVPFMGLLYVGAALMVLMFHYQDIPWALASIFNGAFSPEGVAGGFLGVLILGVRRATFSNEAGLGSAAIAHAAAKTKEPVAEGLVALLEPFVDTVIVCTMTALVIIITGKAATAQVGDGITLTSAAFATVFSWFPYVLAVAAILFAFSTSITWFYYGERSFVYLSHNSKKIQTVYKVAFLGALVVGSAMQLTSVFGFADSMLLAMAVPNMIGLYIMAPEVKQMLNSYLARVKSGAIKPVK